MPYLTGRLWFALHILGILVMALFADSAPVHLHNYKDVHQLVVLSKQTKSYMSVKCEPPPNTMHSYMYLAVYFGLSKT